MNTEEVQCKSEENLNEEKLEDRGNKLFVKSQNLKKISWYIKSLI